MKKINIIIAFLFLLLIPNSGSFAQKQIKILSDIPWFDETGKTVSVRGTIVLIQF